MIELMFKLLVGHALADFSLQSDFIARMKNRWNDNTGTGMWFYVLSSHALTQGGFVFLATGSVGLGIAETVLHWWIDFAKCEQMISLHMDQVLHVLCKVVWAVLVLR